MSYPSSYLKHLLAVNEETLIHQSRSFAIPILNLEEKFKIPVMLEYNLNKTIDTIEDHTTLTLDEKKDWIMRFCNALIKGNISSKLRHNLLSITCDKEKYVFKNYAATIHLFNYLPRRQRELAIYWTQEMASGMIRFLDKPIKDFQDLNEYCYYVAGSVGLYLTELLNHLEKLPSTQYNSLKENAISFGRFLQKLNIIRDYVEDQNKYHGSYWPKELLSSCDIMHTLNQLCYDALVNDAFYAIQYFKHLTSINHTFVNFIKFILFSSMEYIKMLKNNQSVFSKRKLKLPRLFISKLYNYVSNYSHQEFLQLICESYEQELLLMQNLVHS